jgi:hypothetical protein
MAGLAEFAQRYLRIESAEHSEEQRFDSDHGPEHCVHALTQILNETVDAPFLARSLREKWGFSFSNERKAAECPTGKLSLQ